MEDRIFFNQSKYIKEMLKKFGLEDSKPTKTPMSTEIKLTKDDDADSVDSSKYRADLSNPLLHSPPRAVPPFPLLRLPPHRDTTTTPPPSSPSTPNHHHKGVFVFGTAGSTGVVVYVIRKPQGPCDGSIDDLEVFGLVLEVDLETVSRIETIVYADSDHAGDYVDRQITSGVCTFMGCCLTSWFAKKQTALAISTTKAEYISSRKACQQALWMKQALIDYGICLDDVPIMCDNKGAIDLSKNPVQHSRTKHIKIRHHFLCDNVQKGNISIEKVASEDNIADIFTKPLKREVFNYSRLGLGIMKLVMDSDPSSS
ncbi:hypothetical protein Tco_0116747 [Tanacetum coccineum]